MERIKTILVATNYSENARRAETRAAMLSIELKAETLDLMSVGNDEMTTLPGTGDERTAEAVTLPGQQEALPSLLRRKAGPTCIRSVGTGKSPMAIVERANAIQAGLIVVAARGKHFFADFLARHNNDELVRLSERPVLLVDSEPQDAYKSVLVAVDFSAESREAARMALAIAPSAHFIFLHAFRVAGEEMMQGTGVSMDVIHSYRMHARDEARTKLNRFIDELGPRKQLISRAIHHGMPVPVITAQARQLNVDLVALGKHGKSRFVEFLLGSVPQRLLDQGLCDLLVTASSEKGDFDHLPAA